MDLNLKLNFTKEDLFKNRVLLIGIAIGLISIFYGYNKIYKGTINFIQQTESNIYNEGIKIDISKRIEAFQRALGEYKGYFAKERDTLWVVDQISRAANDAGLKVVSLNPQPSVVLKSFIYNSVNVIATGTFHQLGDFVSSIESSKEFMRVERMSVKKNEQVLNAEMVITAYFWK